MKGISNFQVLMIIFKIIRKIIGGEIMLNGLKTYIVIVLMAVYNIMVSAGLLPDISEAEWQTFINVLLVLLAILFNYIGRRRILRTGKLR